MQDIQHLLDRHQQDMQALEIQSANAASERARKLQELERKLVDAMQSQQDLNQQDLAAA